MLPPKLPLMWGLPLALHRIRLEAGIGCSPIWRFKACSPSDSAEAGLGCSKFERFWQEHHRIRPKPKSDGANLSAFCQEHQRNWSETRNGCRASARQAFFTPSNFTETENGCRENARQAFFIPSNLTENENGWKILARQGLRKQIDQEHAVHNSELPSHNRYNMIVPI